MAQISVIVPLYNTVKMLGRCLDSILAQTYGDFKLILVDDGSTDGSGDLCDRYAQTDSRIRVIHQKNSGVGVARNTGLEAAMEDDGMEWITFVDSDDWIHPNMLELLLKTALEKQVKISGCAYLETAGEMLPELSEQILVTDWKIPEFYTQNPILATVPWGKLYHRSCFDTVRYPVGTYFDDEFVTYRLLFDQKEIPVLSARMYAYYVNPDGLTKAPWKPRKLDSWKAFEEQIAFFEQRNDREMVRYRCRTYFECILEYIQSAKSAPNAAELAKEIRFMEKRKREFIPRAWKSGCIDFYVDYEALCSSYPVLTKLYRMYLEKWKYAKWRKRWRRN